MTWAKQVMVFDDRGRLIALGGHCQAKDFLPAHTSKSAMVSSSSSVANEERKAFSFYDVMELL